MPGENPRDPAPHHDPNTYFRHFRESREPLEIQPPPRPWLPGFLTLLCAVLVIVGSLGPWKYVEVPTNTGSETVMVYGARTDGVFSMLFATIAIVGTIFVLVRTSTTIPAWLSFGAMVMCASVGFFDWVLFAPIDTSHSGFTEAETLRFEWGIKVVFLGGVAGIISSFIAARDVTVD